jgi:transcriptional regulator with XRE-family HTH domain
VDTSIQKKVIALRSCANVTQQTIADLLQVDQSFIAKVEQGERKYSFDQLKSISDFFGIRLDHLLSESEPSCTLKIAFRSSSLSKADLSDIAIINRIAVNLGEMRELLEEN